MMKSILLAPPATKYFCVFNGLFYIVLGFRGIDEPSPILQNVSIVGFTAAFIGLLLMIYGVLLFFPSNKLTANVKIDENQFSIKPALLKKRKSIAWDNVKEITYRPYELVFFLKDNGTEVISLKTQAPISIEIKKATREFAKSKEIAVVGG